jgi:hypothetical protein
MICFKNTRERSDELRRVGRFIAAFSEVYWWAGRRAIGDLNIDLERDSCQEVACTLERWEQVESYASLLYVKLTTGMHRCREGQSKP